MGKLVHLLPDGTTREIRLDRERLTIGRRPDNDVCLPQPPVSGEHAVIVTILADSFLEDLGSTNGTLVNGRPVTKHFLHDRDEIDIGREVLVYVVDDSVKLEGRPQPAEGAPGSPSGKDPEAPRAPRAGVATAPNGAQHGKRRSDGQPEGAEQPADAIQRFVAAEIERSVPGLTPAAAGAADDASASPAPDEGAAPLPAVRVLSGAHAGRVMPLAKSETLVGRAGVQVAALRRSDDEIRLVPVEGATLPNVNGVPIAADGQRVAAGDILEIAGARLELVGPTGASG